MQKNAYVKCYIYVNIFFLPNYVFYFSLFYVLFLVRSALVTLGVQWGRAAAPCRHRMKQLPQTSRPHPCLLGAKVSIRVKEQPPSTLLAGRSLGDLSTLWTSPALESKMGIFL